MSIWPFKPKPTPQFMVIARDPIKLRLHEFRSNKSMVGMAQKSLLSPELKIMLDVLRNEHPCMVVMSTGTNPNDRIVAQARGEGYTMALANLEAMGDFQQITEMPEPTFETEEKDK